MDVVIFISVSGVFIFINIIFVKKNFFIVVVDFEIIVNLKLVDKIFFVVWIVDGVVNYFIDGFMVEKFVELCVVNIL